MGRYEIATDKAPQNPEKEKKAVKSVPVKKKKKSLPLPTGQMTLEPRPSLSPPPIPTARRRTQYLYESSQEYPLEDSEIETTQVPPTRTLSLQWPMGHRTIVPLRNLNINITDEGAVTLHLTPNEARAIANDLEQAHNRFDSATEGAGRYLRGGRGY